MNHKNKNALIADFQSNRPHNPLSEHFKTDDSHSGKCGRLRIVRNLSQNSMSLLFEILDGRICFFCDCGTCQVLTEHGH